MRAIIASVNNLREQPALNKWVLFAVLLVLFIPHWIIFYHNFHYSINPDLLLRTIGSRLQEAGKNMYTYKWKVSDPVTWLNPYEDARIGLNGVVSTPFILRLFQPLARLSYCDIRVVWSYTQEVFLFLTVWLCCCTFTQRYQELLFILIAAFFFVYDRNWLLNVYNGQMYVIYALIFALAGYLAIKHKNSSAAIVLYPLITLVRPFFIAAVIPLMAKQRRTVVFLASSFAIAILLAIATTTTAEWKQYNAAMKLYAREQTGELVMGKATPRLYLKWADPCTTNGEATFTVSGAGDLFSLQHYLFLVGIHVSNPIVFQVILVIALVIIFFIAFKNGWLKDLHKQLLLSFLFYQLCELITPASRNPYNMIQWLPAVALLVAAGDKRIISLILIGLCLNHDIPFWFKYEREIGEAFLFVALIVFLFRKNSNVLQSNQNYKAGKSFSA